ncbi:MAG: hypothetical protein NWR21_08610, partial [Verrucomicrobiales bacterium]|nr:hypothetical protein [Verrucomicrobiales bacterium]
MPLFTEEKERGATGLIMGSMGVNLNRATNPVKRLAARMHGRRNRRSGVQNLRAGRVDGVKFRSRPFAAIRGHVLKKITNARGTPPLRLKPQLLFKSGFGFSRMLDTQRPAPTLPKNSFPSFHSWAKLKRWTGMSTLLG